MSSHKTFNESGRLTICKILIVIWFILPLILVVAGLIITPLLIKALTPEDGGEDALQIEDMDFREDYYFESLNETSFELHVKFNRPVHDGYVTVVFFDAKGQQTDELDVHLHTRNYKTTDSHLINTYDCARGEVVSCKIVDISDITYPEERDDGWNTPDGIRNRMMDMLPFCILWALVRTMYVIPVTKYVLSAKCQVFFIGGCYITVYTGWSHHYVKVDGIKVAEQQQRAPSLPISLSTVVNGCHIAVTIDPKSRFINLTSNGATQYPL